MEWKKHSKKISKLKESNTQIDMKVRGRLEEITGEITDKDEAISLEFLKEYLHLAKDDNEAIEELKFHVGLMDGLNYGVIADDTDQSIYVHFTKKED